MLRQFLTAQTGSRRSGRGLGSLMPTFDGLVRVVGLQGGLLAGVGVGHP